MKKVMERTFRRMNANRKNGKKALKGFTLVEIIVVLVILAILAAAMIPALTGYIDKAKEKTAIAEARSIVTAAQTLASEEYAMHGMANPGLSAPDAWLTSVHDNILKLADVTPTAANKTEAKISGLTFSSTQKAKIQTITYVTTQNVTVNYKNGGEFAIS